MHTASRRKVFGVDQYRGRLQQAGIGPDQVMSPFVPTTIQRGSRAMRRRLAALGPVQEGGGPDRESRGYYLRLIEEAHDNGVLNDAEARRVAPALLERLRA
jgi:hypothetical protein